MSVWNRALFIDNHLSGHYFSIKTRGCVLEHYNYDNLMVVMVNYFSIKFYGFKIVT